MTETDGRWQHAAGDTKDGCLACADEAGICCDGCWGREPGPWCTTPEPDPDEPGVCRYCSHTVERAA